MIPGLQGFWGRAPVLTALVLASCDLGTPLPAQAQFVMGPAASQGSGSGATAADGDCASSYASPTLTLTCGKTNGVPFGTGATSAAPTYPASACQPWQILTYSGGWTCTQQSGLEFLAGKASAINMNVAGDNSIAITGPSSGHWVLVRAVIDNCSAVASSAFTAAFWTGVGGTGVNFLGSGSASYGGNTGGAPGTFARVASPYVTPGGTNWQLDFNNSASGTVYFRVSTVAGIAQTCDVSIYAQVV